MYTVCVCVSLSVKALPPCTIETATLATDGFLVHKDIFGNVTCFQSMSDRVAQLTIKIKGKY